MAEETRQLRGQRTVADVLAIYGPAVKARFKPLCQTKSISWPPRRIYLLAFKQERLLELWAANSRSAAYRRLAIYPICAASGTIGPKRRQGDRQVPEGFYELDVLNPNSLFHLSLRVSYPNSEDRAHQLDPQVPLGGDIYVHGNCVSIGCLAMTDPVIEPLFCMVAQADPAERRILIAPVDLRQKPVPPTTEPWIGNLYRRLARALKSFPSTG